MNPESKRGEAGRGKRRRRYTGRVEQAGHLVSWERSGHSGAAYAQAHGLKARDLYRWRKRERAGEPERTDRANGSGFMTIDVYGRAFGGTGDGGLRVVLRRGALEVEVSGGGSADELARLAGALRREVLDA